jgi:hypothetical protein
VADHAKEGPTLIDTVFRATFEKRTPFTIDLRQKLFSARRFVLDDNMSAFLADIGWAAYRAKPAKAVEILDNVRKLARLPYPVTWLEWNEQALATRARAEYDSAMRPDIVPEKTGWLLIRHPYVETAAMALSFGVGGQSFEPHPQTGDPMATGRRMIGGCPFSFAWNADDAPVPWPDLPIAGPILEKRGVSAAGLITSFLSYKGPISICSAAPYMKLELGTDRFVEQMLAEQGGMGRYVLGLLATVNDLPVGIETVTTSKGFIARGNYRKYLDHKVIRLTVPQDRHRALARKAITILRRRGGPVRGHWREDWRFPLSPLCEDHAEARMIVDGNFLKCPNCQGRKMWVKDHTRGDTSQGFVNHDYEVTTHE